MIIRKAVLAVAFLALLLISLGSTLIVHSPVQAVGTPDFTKTWTLSRKNGSEDSQSPAYHIRISQPVLTTADKAGDAFNALVSDFLAKAEDDFKNSAKGAIPNTTGPGADSELQIWYDIYVSDTDVISTQYHIYSYIAGAAHPLTVTHTSNFNMATGAEITLESLFKPNSNYLNVIAQYCIKQLTQEKRLAFPDGAAAKPENYANWMIDRSGLLMVFDPYQVGPYVQGISTVLVPFSALSDILANDVPISIVE